MIHLQNLNLSAPVQVWYVVFKLKQNINFLTTILLYIAIGE